MNTTYFLNLVSGNVFGSKKTPAVPEKCYLGLSSAAPALDGQWALLSLVMAPAMLV